MPQSHAIISGGSSGIGLAVARRLAAAGWDITILAQNPERLSAARDALAALCGADQHIRSDEVDVADSDAVARAVAAAIAALGPPSLLIASAGIVVPGLFAEQPLDAFRRTMDVNYFGTLHLIRSALPAMRRAGGGRIVLIASGAALLGVYGFTSYAPAKFAVRGLAETLRSELAPEGIGVSIVYPPDTDTPQLREELRLRPDITSRIAGNAKVLSADDVAGAILRGIARHRFTIAPGAQMAALALFHSLAGPLLHRFWFDPLVARSRRNEIALMQRGAVPPPASTEIPS